ncbi:hypothetical protein D3C77_460530 [compost metagenome]
MNAHTLETRRQGTVADVGDDRCVHRLAPGGQGGVGHPRLDVGQAHLAPLADDIAVAVGQGPVVGAGDGSAPLFQGDGVVGGYFGGETDGAFGKARAVVEDGALDPVVTAVGVVAGAVALVVLPQRRAGGAFAGVPVAGRTGQALAFDKAAGLALGTGVLGTDRDEVLAGGLSLGHDGQACEGQGKNCRDGSSQGKAPFLFFFF